MDCNGNKFFEENRGGCLDESNCLSNFANGFEHRIVIVDDAYIVLDIIIAQR